MALPPPPAGLDLTETRVPEIYGSLVPTWIFAIIAVGLRVAARRLQASKLFLDDWLVAITLIACTVHVWISLGYMVPHGTGLHIWAAPPEAAWVWAQGLLVSELAYTITMVTVKWSTLWFYWRLFNAEPTIRTPILVLAAVVGAWGIAIFLVSILTCVPVHAQWDRFNPVSPMPPTDFKCGVESSKFFIGNSVPTIVTDAFIVALPAPYVWRLQLPMAQRIAILAIFLLGAFVTIISMVRFNFILNVDLASPDITWNFSNAIIWTNAESNIAVVCCCLPSLKPILNLLIHGRASLTTGGGSGGSGSKQKGSGGGADNSLVTFGQGGGRRVDNDGRPFAWLDDHSEGDLRTTKAASDELGRVEQGRAQQQQQQQQGASHQAGSPAESIVITKQFQMSSTSERDAAEAEASNASYYQFNNR
ncbi:hypothetical protein RB601_005756 [Gaeumannomyces tritici]